MRSSRTTHSEEPRRTVNPVYRINYWVRPAPGVGWNLDARLLFDATDVTEALAWAAAHAENRKYEVLVESDGLGEAEPRRSTLVRLYGTDPN